MPFHAIPLTFTARLDYILTAVRQLFMAPPDLRLKYLRAFLEVAKDGYVWRYW